MEKVLFHEMGVSVRRGDCRLRRCRTSGAAWIGAKARMVESGTTLPAASIRKTTWVLGCEPSQKTKFVVFRVRKRHLECVAIMGVVTPTTPDQATFAAASVAASNRRGSELHSPPGRVRRFSRRVARRLLPTLRAQEEARQAAVVADILRRRKKARRAP